MKITNFLHPKRLFLLLKKDFYTQYKTFLLSLGAMFSLLFIINIVSVATAQSWNFNLIFYPLTLFIGGFIFTSISFSELRQEQSGTFYLCIPASNLEKFISQLLITSLGYIFMSLLLFSLFSLIVFSLSNLFFGITHSLFNPLHSDVWLCIRVYLITQSVFLFGSIHFKKNALIKTVVFFFVLSIFYFIFILITSYAFHTIISFNKEIYFSFKVFDKPYEFFNNDSLIAIKVFIENSFPIFFWFLLAPLFWVIAFFRLRERGIN